MASIASQKGRSPSPSPVGKSFSQGDKEYYQNLDFKTLNHETNDETQRFFLFLNEVKIKNKSIQEILLVMFELQDEARKQLDCSKSPDQIDL